MRRASPAALALALPTVVAAQGTTITPSLAASETYDGNLFASASNAQETLVHRFGPRLEVDRRSAAFSLLGRYELDAEYVQALPDEGVHLARQLGSIELRYRPTRRLAFEGVAEYLDTRTPVELSTVTALDRGRVRARRFAIGPSIDYELDRRSRSKAGYSFARDHVLGSTTDAHVANAEIAHRFTRTGTGSAGLLLRQLVFDRDALVPSQVPLLGWRQRFARRTSAAIQAGPRLRGAKVEGVEALASVRQGVDRAELEASYTRAETTLLGLSRSLETDAAAVSATLRLEPSLVLASAGLARTHGSALRADVLHARIEATTPVQPWLSAALSLTLTFQRLETASEAAGAVTDSRVDGVFHEVVALTLEVAPPKPLEL